ncbi:mobilization protein, partial [Staphylococcus cohnii]
MSEHDNNLASDLSVGGNRKPNRKEPKQISFRVNEGEYEKLRSSAETLNMSVPTFVKKKAQGSRLVAPKLDKETRQSIVKDLGSMGANVNQIAKWFNQHKEQAVNLPEQKYDDLIKQFDDFKKELHEI